MDRQEEAILKVTKEIVVKFIETGRLSLGTLENTYKLVNRVVRENIRPIPGKDSDSKEHEEE